MFKRWRWIVLWMLMLLPVMFPANAMAEDYVGDICFFRTQDGIYAKAYRQGTDDLSLKLVLAVYENGVLKNVDITSSSTESVVTSAVLPLLSEEENVKAFAVTEDFSPAGRVYTPEDTEQSFTVTAKVYGKNYAGKVNARNHTITFDVPKNIAEDLNASISREESGYLPIGNSHFDTEYTMLFQGVTAKYRGEKVSSNTTFDINGDYLLDITGADGQTHIYTAEVHVSEIAQITQQEDGFSVCGIHVKEAPDKLTINWKLKVESAASQKDLFLMGCRDLPLAAIATTKDQEEGYFALKVGENDGNTYGIPVHVPAFAMNQEHELTYIFRKAVDGGVCELYADSILLASVPCDAATAQRLGQEAEGCVFFTERLEDAEYTAVISNSSASIVRSRPELYVEKLPEGKNTAYTFTGDDGYINSAKWYYNTFRELGIRGSLAVNSRKTNTDGLKPYVSDGILDVGNHGATHKTLTQVDDSTLDDEVNNGQKELREQFEGSSVLTMYLPSNQRNDKVMEKIKENHYAVRCSGSNQSNSLYLGKEGLYTTTFYSVLSPTENNAGTDLARLNWRFDDALAKGRWIVEMWHEVSGDDVDGEPNLKAPYVYDSAEAKKHFIHIAEHLDEVYCGGYETMVQYLLERDYLRFTQVSATADQMTFHAECDKSMLINAQDAEYFNTPLTINMIVPKDWAKALVIQDGRENVYPVYCEQSAVLGAEERSYVLFDVIPGGGEITVKSVPEDFEILGDEAEITAAEMKIGTNTYAATVNTVQHEITFSVPYATLKSELTDVLSGRKSPAIMPDMSAVQIVLTGKGRMMVDGKKVAKTFTADMDKLKEIVVEATNVKQTYKVRFLPMLLAGRYDSNGAALTSTTETQASRRGVPKSLLNGSIYAGNYGEGVWRINQSGMAYLEDGTVDDANTYASLTIASRTDNSNDQYIRLNKYKSTAGTSAKVQLYRQSNYGNASKAVRAKLKFNLHSFTKNNDGMIYLWASDLDQIVLSSKNMAANQFTLCHRGTNTDAMQSFDTPPVLETNTWYTLITEFYRSEMYSSGYYIDVYLQREGEEMQYLGRISDQASCPTGNVTYGGGKNEFMLAAWSNAIFDIGIDDYEVMTIESDAQYDTTVHLLGDSICRYYDTGKLAPQQGWGAYVHEIFDERVRVLNYSVGGYNTNIYLHGANRPNLTSPPIIASLCRTLREGDYVVVALGWNEANAIDGSWNTATFQKNLEEIASQCEAKGASMIFITSTPNLTSDYTGLGNSCLQGLKHIKSDGQTEWVYPVTGMKNFAEEKGYVCLDLNTAMYERLASMDFEECKELFTGSTSAQTNNAINKDNLHITEAGAQLAGQLIQELLEKSVCPLKEYVKY